MEENSLAFDANSHEQVTSEYLKLMKASFCIELTLMLLICFGFLGIPVEYSLLPMLCMNMHQIFVQWKILRQNSFLQGLNTKFEGYILLQQMSDCLSKTFLIIQLRYDQFPIVAMAFYCIPFILHYYYKDKDYHNMQAYVHTHQMLLRLCLIVSMFIYVYDYYGMVETTWTDILLPVLIYFILNAVCYFINIVYKMTYKIYSSSSPEENIAPMDICANCVLFLTSLIIICNVLSLAVFLEEQYLETLLLTGALFVANCSIVSGAAWLFRKPLVIWTLNVFEYEKTIPIPILGSDSLAEVPKLFVRLSRDYYKAVFESDIDESQNSVDTKVQALLHEKDSEFRYREVIEHLENPETVNEELCTICYEHAAEIVFLPCGHGNVCFFCSKQLIYANRCHICRMPAQYIVKVKQDSKFALVIL